MEGEFNRDELRELPQGWVWAPLGGFLKTRGETVEPQRRPDEQFVLYSVPSFDSGQPELVFGRDIGSSKQRVAPDDVLLCKINPRINRSWIVRAHADREVIASTEWIILNGKGAVDPAYLQLILQQARVRNFLASNVSGVGGSLMRVKPSTVQNFPFPVAPLPEQRRIVARIDELFTDIADGEVVLNRARDDLYTWRRALLKAAVTGELTHDWREHNKAKETGKDLLRRITTAREAHGKSAARGRRTLHQDSPDESPFDLPGAWEWSTLGAVGEIVGGVTVDKKRTPNNPVTVPYLRVANVQRGYLDLSEVKLITVDREVAERLALKKGDILLNEGGDRDKIGRGWVWEGQIEGCIHQNHVFRVRPYDPSIDSYFVSHFANEMGRRFFIEKGKQTTNLASISLSKISQLPIPIVPTSELREAMRILDTSLTATVDVEAQLMAAALSRAARQSILKAAFDGRLTEQDPSDEPADRLLGRLNGGETAPVRRSRGRRPATRANA